MKIAHITYGLSMGGIESMLVNIANYQTLFGHDVSIYIVNDLVDQTLVERLNSDVKVNFIGRAVGSLNPYYFFQLNRLLYKNRPDIVHLHYSKLSPYIVIPSLRKRFCVTLHCPADDDSTSSISKCGPVVSISQLVRAGLKERYRVDSKVIYNGIDVNSIRQREPRDVSKPLRIVQVARLDHELKGQDILIRAAAYMKDKGFSDFTITFIGDGTSRNYLENLALELNVTDNIEFLGTRSQDYVFDNLCEYDLFVHPARVDGFALTVAEAMVAGVPVMVSDSQGPYEVIEYGKYGYSFKTNDYKDCALQILKFAENGIDHNKVSEARKCAFDNYDVKVTSQKYIELYEDIIRDCK